MHITTCKLEHEYLKQFTLWGTHLSPMPRKIWHKMLIMQRWRRNGGYFTFPYYFCVIEHRRHGMSSLHLIFCTGSLYGETQCIAVQYNAILTKYDSNKSRNHIRHYKINSFLRVSYGASLGNSMEKVGARYRTCTVFYTISVFVSQCSVKANIKKNQSSAILTLCEGNSLTGKWQGKRDAAYAKRSAYTLRAPGQKLLEQQFNKVQFQLRIFG